ncbi:MAG TPA: thioesterase family protein [Geminicoccaceae bacterium]|nr:thioesterase family protein [Geminicoccaceae bacterium]
MTESELPFPLNERTSYRFWSDEKLRFADLDLLGHVNNTAYAVFSESARIAFVEAHGCPAVTEATMWVLARLTIDFLAPLRLDAGRVEIGTRPIRVGRSSVTLGQGMFVGGLCAATAVAVGVLADRRTERSTPLPEDFRRRVLDGAVRAG